MACDRTVAETIETLTERLQSSTLLEDRRDACRALRSLAKDYRVEVCAQAMDVLLLTIKTDRHDTEMVNYCLDSLNYIISGHLCDLGPAATWPDSDIEQMNDDVPGENTQSSSFNNTTDTSRSQTSRVSAPHDPGRELAEIFLKKAENVTVILDTVIEDDSNTKWGAVRLLCGLSRQKLPMVQEAILSFPLGISRLTQLISEEHEVIRNDALALFVRLTQTNTNIQNLVVYENCFDKLMYIVEMEEYLDGTVAVVMDILSILFNLIQNNEPNRILFREGGHLQKLAPFFSNVANIQWTEDKTACIVLVLQVMDSMLLPTNSSIHIHMSREILIKLGILDKLCDMVTARAIPISVLSETLNTASDIIRGASATMMVQANSMMPILLLSMVKDMCQDQERKISELYQYIHSLHNYMSSQAWRA